MYNPINRLINVTKNSGILKPLRPHWSVSALELAAFLSFLPGMFIFFYAFVLSAAALYAAFEVTKRNFSLAISLFALFNCLPGFFGLLAFLLTGFDSGAGLAIALLYGTLGIWGIAATNLQRRLAIL